MTAFTVVLRLKIPKPFSSMVDCNKIKTQKIKTNRNTIIK